MKHKVSINDKKTLELVLRGKISKTDFGELKSEIENLVKKIKKEGNKLRLLTDFTHAAKHDFHGNNLLDYLLLNDDLYLLAFYGLDRTPRDIMIKKIKQNNLSEKARLFRTNDEAEQWLTDS